MSRPDTRLATHHHHITEVDTFQFTFTTKNFNRHSPSKRELRASSPTSPDVVPFGGTVFHVENKQTRTTAADAPQRRSLTRTRTRAHKGTRTHAHERIVDHVKTVHARPPDMTCARRVAPDITRAITC